MAVFGLDDTDPRAREVWLEILRRKTPGEKLAMVFELTDMAIRASEAGVRLQYPAATGREVFLLAAARRLGRETMIRVYGWDPEEYERGARA